jgi:hypothetical protein
LAVALLSAAALNLLLPKYPAATLSLGSPGALVSLQNEDRQGLQK